MAKSNDDTAILFISLLVTLGLIGGGLWFFGRGVLPKLTGSTPPPPNPSQTGVNPPASSTSVSLNTTLPNPAQLTIDGSVTMVSLMKRLQSAYSQVNPSISTTYGIPDGKPNGTNQGIQNLIDGKVWLAASSRSLTPEEFQVGLKAIPIAKDALAIAVSLENQYKGGLTMQQLKQIYTGQITNWSQVGGANLPIKVLNRAPASGTYTLFKEIVLQDQAFAPDSANFTTLKQDETTPMLRALGNNGIGYSTVSQIENQQTVRVVPINGISPSDRNAIRDNLYPISRIVYLVVKEPTSPAVQQFIEMTLSPQGQQIVSEAGFIPLQ